MKILCKLGFHKIVVDRTWYYVPDVYCERCGTENVYTLLERYCIWASLHTMNPFAWPFVLWYSIIFWWEDRKDENK